MRWLTDNIWYLVFFAIGMAVAAPYSTAQVMHAIDIVGVLMLVALFASLLVPFAAFSRQERLNRWWLLYGPLPAFGAYAVTIIREPSAVGALLIIAAMGMHFAYWTSGIHSRAYRREMWSLAGYNTGRPKTTELIAVLCARGDSGAADQIAISVLCGVRFPHIQHADLSELYNEAQNECQQKDTLAA